MDEENEQILTSATERALVIDEIIFAIGEKLKRPKDICSASACCKSWRKILIHLIARCADVYVEDAESFMDFLRSYPSVKWNCQALRVSVAILEYKVLSFGLLSKKSFFLIPLDLIMKMATLLPQM